MNSIKREHIDKQLSLESLFHDFGFEPNDGQREAILHVNGPLLITAGPGSGKTRVLLWRTLNLIVFHSISPDEIFLSTFTEKAAKQLKDGLLNILGYVSNKTGRPYDISNMAIGTVHSICQRLISDRRFSKDGERNKVPKLMDQLAQYFYLNRRIWKRMMEHSEFEIDPHFNSYNDGHLFINQYIGNKNIGSKHFAVMNCIKGLNRFSEERMREIVDPILSDDDEKFKELYDFYCRCLKENRSLTDFALLQEEAIQTIDNNPSSSRLFKHVIIDEYQDTNSIQEQLFFKLARGHKNICVVGDDDQALYRFRGATVENLVEFNQRSRKYLGLSAHRVNLQTNYRSRKRIVDFYTSFMNRIPWNKSDGSGHYRVMDKGIHAFSDDIKLCVFTTDRTQLKADVGDQVAQTIIKLKESGKIQDYNQVAFLFPSLKNQGEPNAGVTMYKEALERNGLQVYAPRAGRFIEVEEAKAIFGLFIKIFNQPEQLEIQSRNYLNFFTWIRSSRQLAEELIEEDSMLKEFVSDSRNEWKEKVSDFHILFKYFSRKGLSLEDEYDPLFAREIQGLSQLSEDAKRIFSRKSLQDLIRSKYLNKDPFSVRYIINRLTSLDWSLMDLFYQLMGFQHFKRMFDLAENGEDEGPICNLSLISGYIARFMDEYVTLITGSYLSDGKFTNSLFNSFCYALFRLAESEYEDTEDPFPKGRVPFLTIHQSKGLEFPVVVIGNLMKRNYGPDPLEERVREITGKGGEPLNRYSEFDIMRMFYVGLSRAQNLLILPQYKRSQVYAPLKMIQNGNLPNLDVLQISEVPEAKRQEDDLGKNYSYTGDYLSYLKCPRFYMIFKKYNFAPSRSQSMFFGSLVHRTIEDLHLFLMNKN